MTAKQQPAGSRLHSNMSKRLQQVGIDRVVRLAWLEMAAEYALAGDSPTTAKQKLREALLPLFPSAQNTTRGSLDKTLTVLMKTWFTPPVELTALRDAGLDLLAKCPASAHIAVHWGMLMAVYPFWGSVATQAGRLLRLQDAFTTAQLQRRIREQYGERELVSRRVRYVVQSFLDWRIVCESGKPGVYCYCHKAPVMVKDSLLAAWLVEALLHIRDSMMAPVEELLRAPAMFPFRLPPFTAANIENASGRLRIVAQGGGELMIRLKH